MRVRWVFAAIAALAFIGPVAAQQPPEAILNGRFSAIEAAPDPADAARMAGQLTDSLRALQPQRRGHEDVYLIAASLWGEPVFEREVTQAEAILRQRLGADGRSIVLSAGGQGARALPAATPGNVAAAIGQVGSLIDPSEDLVVVFLTSHGRSDGSMALHEDGRVEGSLRPNELAAMLNIAGIRNRVVIISACFSGAFIPPLATGDTIVMAAAQRDRTSFGCQPQRDWTFFGDAYFSHALCGGADFVTAFDQAKTLIARWERQQNLSPPSNPQIFVGAHAAQMLRDATGAMRANPARDRAAPLSCASPPA